LVGIILLGLIIIFFVWRASENKTIVDSSSMPPPSKMAKLGPVTGAMISSKTIGDVTIKMEASRTSFKKSKTFGFDNGLFKKLVASDFCLTISKGGRKLLVLNKNQVEMPMDQNVIEINNPQIIFPAEMKEPDSIKLDSQKLSVRIKNGKTEEIWDLAKM